MRDGRRASSLPHDTDSKEECKCQVAVPSFPSDVNRTEVEGTVELGNSSKGEALTNSTVSLESVNGKCFFMV